MMGVQLGSTVVSVSATIQGELSIAAMNTNADPEYEGSYNVISKVNESVVLSTKDRALRDNVTVLAIPQFEISNDAGGSTLIIGREYYDHGNQ